MDKPDLRPAKEIAAILKTSLYRLGTLRKRGRGPAYIRINARKILYDFRDVETWLEQQKTQPKDKIAS
jgi:hypothetical protein